MPTSHHNVVLAIEALQQGKMIILTDDNQRENEGDMVVAAQFINEAHMNMMRREGSGIVCLASTQALLARLKLPLMVAEAENKSQANIAAFTLSVDAKHGIKSGVSVQDRVKTISTIINDETSADDLVRPGHIFPLQARDQGVLEREGHTEGAVDLMKLAGLKPAAVICELMNTDGSVMQDDALFDFANAHHLLILSIADLKAYRLAS